MSVQPFFRWYDLWIGAYIEREKVNIRCSDPQCGDSTWDHFCDGRTATQTSVYICPLPMMGVRVRWQASR